MSPRLKRALRSAVHWISMGTASCGATATASHSTPPSPQTVTQSPLPPNCPTSRGQVVLPLADAPVLRSELTRAKDKGVIVLREDCGRFSILDRCSMLGSYALAAISSYDGVGQDADSAPVLSQRSAGRGEVGRWSTSIRVAYEDELIGACEHATHFVRFVDEGSQSARGSRAALATRAMLVPIKAARPPWSWLPEQAHQRLNGNGTAREPKRSCESGEAAGCAQVHAQLLEAGNPAALEYAKRGCALGDAVACGHVTDRLFSSETSADADTARWAWRRACEGGLAQRCWAWALWTKQQPSHAAAGLTAYQAWVRGCQRGSSASCYEAAQLRLSGCAETSDSLPDRAGVRAGARAREQGSMVVAQRPSGEERPGPEAVDLLAASCPVQGPKATEAHWNGCMQWAAMLENGDGTTKAPERARDIYMRVCDMKIIAGCREAGRMLESAAGGQAEAVGWYGRGCRLGDLDACMKAAQWAGDKESASKWYEEACQRYGHGAACQTRKQPR